MGNCLGSAPAPEQGSSAAPAAKPTAAQQQPVQGKPQLASSEPVQAQVQAGDGAGRRDGHTVGKEEMAPAGQQSDGAGPEQVVLQSKGQAPASASAEPSSSELVSATSHPQQSEAKVANNPDATNKSPTSALPNPGQPTLNGSPTKQTQQKAVLLGPLAEPGPDGNGDATTASVVAATSTSTGVATSNSDSDKGTVSTWDKAKMLFSLTRPEELLNDLHDLKYIGAGGYGKVFKAVWRSAPVAVKLVPSHSPELFKSSSYKEALLCKELCHPNIVQTYETRCAQLSDEFISMILSSAEAAANGQAAAGGQQLSQGQGSGSAPGGSYASQEFVSGDGFGLPSPVPDMLVRGRALPEAAGKWKDILFTTGAKAGDYLTVIIMDYCDYGSLVRPILKGMFRPVSASGSDREARVRYRALLRTAKEIAQGLEHLHHLKVVHGDLKPGNVLLKGSRSDVRGFTAQVIDFGLSHLVSNSAPQRVSKAGGTLVYAAPEVFTGTVGKAADVYSLGIILWEMVTGSQPYKDLDEGQIVLGVQRGGLRPTWPPGQLWQLQELYEKCVAQDAESRPKAKEVVQMLTQIEMDVRQELKAQHRQQQAQQAAMAHVSQQQALQAQALQAQAAAMQAHAAHQQQQAAAQAAYQQQQQALQQQAMQQQVMQQQLQQAQLAALAQQAALAAHQQQQQQQYRAG